jgi:hypothetical protein
VTYLHDYCDRAIILQNGIKIFPILTGFEDLIVKNPVLLDLENNLTKSAVDWEVNTYGHTIHRRPFARAPIRRPGRASTFDNAKGRPSWLLPMP